jgi:glutamine cyclotransferase
VKVKEVAVFHPHSRQRVNNLNEIEFFDGYIFANVWYEDYILKIHAHSGEVVGRLDLSALYPHRTRSRDADCLNGIAFNHSEGSFLLTGKLWPRYYAVYLHEDMHRTELKKRRRTG